MIFPSATVAPSIKTFFIDGIKFDICEVIKDCYNMLSKSTSRFFLCVDDSHIVGYEFATKYYNISKEVRWDLFCSRQKECVELVNGFQTCYEKITKLKKKIEANPALEMSYGQQIQKLQKLCMYKYGTYPHF